MTLPNISANQIAIDPANGILYYVNESTIIATSLELFKDVNGISLNDNLTVAGDLVISGTTTTINTETLVVEDNIIIINKGHGLGSATPNNVSGIEIDRGSSLNVSIRWNETDDKWQLTNDGINYSDIPLNAVTSSELDLKANIAGPTFTGTVSGITAAMVGAPDGSGTSIGANTGDDAINALYSGLAVSKVATTTTISTDAPLTGGGDLSANRTLGIDAATTSAAGSMSASDKTKLDGVATGANLYVHPNHSGDVTSAADGAQTIAANAVTNAKAAQMATKTYKGRTAAGTGDPEDVGVATLKTDLVLVKADVSLGSVDDTTDLNKPVSTAQQTALDFKADSATPNFTGPVSGVTKAMVGLGNADDTADANKPVSSAQLTALDLKANLENPIFTGVPYAPTATEGDDTEQVATTAFVTAAVAASIILPADAAILETFIAAKGDLIVGTANDTPAILTLSSTNGYFLRANTAVGSTFGVEWGEVDLTTKANIASPTFIGTVTTPVLVVDDIEIDTTGATNGQILKFNSALNKFAPGSDNVAVAGSLSLSDLTDVIITGSPTIGQVISYDGAEWVNGPAPTLNINSYKTTIGDSVISEFTITHNLNTQDVMFVARNAVTPYENIDVAWAAASANTVTLYFSTPPANSSVRIGILSL